MQSVRSQSPVPPPIAELRAALNARFPGAIQTLKPNNAESSPRKERSAPSSSLLAPLRQVEPLHLGKISEVVGAPGSGGCSLVLKAIAASLHSTADASVQSQRYASWIDLTESFYPPAAASLGVPLERLILIRPSELTLALHALEIILRGGSTHSVILDVPENTPPLKLGTYHRLKRRVRESGCGLCVLTPHSIIPTNHRIVLDDHLEMHKYGRTA